MFRYVIYFITMLNLIIYPVLSYANTADLENVFNEIQYSTFNPADDSTLNPPPVNSAPVINTSTSVANKSEEESYKIVWYSVGGIALVAIVAAIASNSKSDGSSNTTAGPLLINGPTTTEDTTYDMIPSKSVGFLYTNGTHATTSSQLITKTTNVIEGVDSGTTITNNYRMDLAAEGSIGMYAMAGANAVNTTNVTSPIIANASNTYAMYALSGAEVINTGVINVLSGYGMYAGSFGGVANNANPGVINISLSGVGMYGGYIINSGNINISSPLSGAVGMVAKSMFDNSTGYAENTGQILVNNSRNYAMIADGNAVAKNSGSIQLSGGTANATSYGLYAINGGAIVNTGNINIASGSGIAMWADGASKAYNQGTIRLAGNNSRGMFATGGSIAYNLATIETTNATNVSTGLYGMYGDATSTLYNYGDITIGNNITSTNNSVIAGMYTGASAYNMGTININSNQSIGMYGGNVINYATGTINLTGSNNIAMQGRFIQNHGILNLNGNNSSAFVLTNCAEGSCVVANTGTVNLAGNNSYVLDFTKGSGSAVDFYNTGSVTFGSSATNSYMFSNVVGTGFENANLNLYNSGTITCSSGTSCLSSPDGNVSLIALPTGQPIDWSGCFPSFVGSGGSALPNECKNGETAPTVPSVPTSPPYVLADNVVGSSTSETTVTNSTTITLGADTKKFGLFANGFNAVATNDTAGIINVYNDGNGGGNSAGLIGSGYAKLLNEGIINVQNTSHESGMYVGIMDLSGNSLIKNTGTINVNGSAYGTYSSSIGIAYNEGIINVNANGRNNNPNVYYSPVSIGMAAISGSTAINRGKISVNVDYENGSVDSNGVILDKNYSVAYGYGMYTEGGTLVNEESGVIEVDGGVNSQGLLDATKSGQTTIISSKEGSPSITAAMVAKVTAPNQDIRMYNRGKIVAKNGAVAFLTLGDTTGQVKIYNAGTIECDNLELCLGYNFSSQNFLNSGNLTPDNPNSPINPPSLSQGNSGFGLYNYTASTTADGNIGKLSTEGTLPFLDVKVDANFSAGTSANEMYFEDVFTAERFLGVENITSAAVTWNVEAIDNNKGSVDIKMTRVDYKDIADSSNQEFAELLEKNYSGGNFYNSLNVGSVSDFNSGLSQISAKSAFKYSFNDNISDSISSYMKNGEESGVLYEDNAFGYKNSFTQNLSKVTTSFVINDDLKSGSYNFTYGFLSPLNNSNQYLYQRNVVETGLVSNSRTVSFANVKEVMVREEPQTFFLSDTRFVKGFNNKNLNVYFSTGIQGEFFQNGVTNEYGSQIYSLSLANQNMAMVWYVVGQDLDYQYGNFSFNSSALYRKLATKSGYERQVQLDNNIWYVDTSPISDNQIQFNNKISYMKDKLSIYMQLTNTYDGEYSYEVATGISYPF